MPLSEKWRKGLFSLCLLLLLFLPSVVTLYHLPYYYLLMALLLLFWILTEKFRWRPYFDRRFLLRWPKQRLRGKSINILAGTLQSLVYISIIVCLGQWFGNNLTPLDILISLNGKDGLLILGLLLFFSLASGTAQWYDREKKYARLKASGKVL